MDGNFALLQPKSPSVFIRAMQNFTVLREISRHSPRSPIPKTMKQNKNGRKIMEFYTKHQTIRGAKADAEMGNKVYLIKMHLNLN